MFRAEPHYPSRCRRRGHEGLVVIEVLLSAQGTPIEAKVVQGAGCERLDAAALEALFECRFTPVTGGDPPAPRRERIEFEFRLRTS